MKNFTRNFIAIMFAGVLMMTMLAKDFFVSDNIVSVQAADQSADADDTIISVEKLSPDEIDIKRPFSEERMGGVRNTDKPGIPTTFPGDERDTTTVTAHLTTQLTTGLTTQLTDQLTTEITTEITTDLTTTTTKITTTTIRKKDNDVADIKNPNYKSKYYTVVYTGNQSGGLWQGFDRRLQSDNQEIHLLYR